jgi:hypothetical protein
MTNGLIQYYGFYNHRVKLCKLEIPMIRIRSDLQYNEKSFTNFRKGEHKFFCVQDLTIEDDPAVDAQLETFFKRHFPQAAPWEYGDTGAGMENVTDICASNSTTSSSATN